MGKISEKKHPPVSAFAAYTTDAMHSKKERTVTQKTNLEKSDSKESVASTSFIKHISNKAALSLKRGSIKRKRKKLQKLAEASASTHWRPSCDPSEEVDKLPVVNFSSMKNPSFKGSKNSKAAKCTQDNNRKRKVEKSTKENQIVYKEARSVELSTSMSLSEEEESVKKNEQKKCEGMSVDLVVASDIVGSPPSKKVRRENDDHTALNTIASKSLAENDETKLHGKNKRSSTSSYATISKKSSSIPKMPFPEGDSQRDGQLLFQWLIHPFATKKFFSNVWEKKPLLVRRHITDYAEGLFSSQELNRILTECNVRFGVNLDVTTYQDSVRETHNVEGRAFAPVVWDYYKNDCSVRIKNPQAFSKSVWKLCSTLQEYFKSMVGANIYLTPPGSQGFAPHYDDIEAFVLQLEGKKQWSLYDPRSTEETLPRYSSQNFEQGEIGSEIFSTVLEPGDLLYFPRGFIHQAKSLTDAHSLHITISTYQKNSWGDFMEELIPSALAKAIAEDVEFRKGLPLDFLSNLGVQNSEKSTARREEILGQVSSLLHRLADHLDPDAAADSRGVEFLHSALPPVFTTDEKSRSIHGATVKFTSPGRPSACICGIEINTKIRVVRKNAVRLCVNLEPDMNAREGVRVYHSVQNSRIYHEEEKKYFEMESEYAPALEYLIDSYPEYVTVESLPLTSDEEKITLVTSFLEKGILITEGKIKMIT